jgi:hypothetical protein
MARRFQQPYRLQEADCTTRRATPMEATSLKNGVRPFKIAAGKIQIAILELAIHEYHFIYDESLANKLLPPDCLHLSLPTSARVYNGAIVIATIKRQRKRESLKMGAIHVDRGGYDGYDFLVLRRFRMKELYDLLASKRRELQHLQKEVEALELASRLIQGEKPATQNDTSIPQRIVAILQAEGKPMHVSKIAEALRTKFKISAKKNNLGVLLYRYAQRGSRFYKDTTKPNTYGLIEWKGSEKVVAMA